MADETPKPLSRPVPWKGRQRVKDPRHKFVAVRCTLEDHARITERATRAGLTVGAYLRTVALGDAGPRARRQPPALRQELARILGLLGNYCSNLNQLARNSHTSGELPTALQLTELVEQVSALRPLLMQALGRADPPSGSHGD